MDLSPDKGENVPSGQDLHSLVSMWSAYFPGEQSVQLVSSSAAVLLVLPIGQLWQDVAWSNGALFGFAMNVPGEQHPKRPVVAKKLMPDKAAHWPPHKVRVKPLSRNTLKKKQSIENVTLFKNEISAAQ